GVLRDPQDRAVGLAPIRLVPREASTGLYVDNGFEAALTVTDPAGRFTFLGVPAGQYVLRCRRPDDPPVVSLTPPVPGGRGAGSLQMTPTLWAEELTLIDRGDVALTVRLREGLQI